MKIIKAIDLTITNADNYSNSQQYAISDGPALDCSSNGDGYGAGDVSGRGDMTDKYGNSQNFYSIIQILDNLKMRS